MLWIWELLKMAKIVSHYIGWCCPFAFRCLMILDGPSCRSSDLRCWWSILYGLESGIFPDKQQVEWAWRLSKDLINHETCFFLGAFATHTLSSLMCAHQTCLPLKSSCERQQTARHEPFFMFHRKKRPGKEQIRAVAHSFLFPRKWSVTGAAIAGKLKVKPPPFWSK